jgi:hypothetical protein
MIDLYYWTTAYGHKITTLLEETGTPYTIKSTSISKGEQFSPEFLSVSPRESIRARPATDRACARAKEIKATATISAARSRQVLFGQTASVAR